MSYKQQYKAKREEGFTIIEVMIVLAIAGLILLIVFLAVPALQRNARNTSIKNDASAISAAITEYESNNSGSLPTNASGTTGPTISVNGGGATNAATAKVQGTTTVAWGAAAPAGNLNTSQITVALAAACPGGTASSRTVAVYYGVETTSSASTNGCIQT